MDHRIGGPTLLPGGSRRASSIMNADAEHGFLCFRLGQEEFGVDLNMIVQIVKPPPVTCVPRVGPHILGVISIRGAVVTLVDLRLLMGLEPSQWPRGARILLVELDDERIGLLVDAVTQVRRLDDDALEKNPELDDPQASERVLYVARPDAHTQLTVVDLQAILGEAMR
jgi:purine-binding chemotaxis protein CheW